MVLSCRRPAGVCPLASDLPSAKQISMATSPFCAKSWDGPYRWLPDHKTAFKWPLGAPVAQNCLSKASRSTDPSSTAPKVCFSPGGPPHTQTLNGSSLLSCARPQRLPTVGVAVSLRFVAVASALCAKAKKTFKPARRLRANPKP